MRTEIADQEAALFTLDKILDEMDTLPQADRRQAAAAPEPEALQAPKSA